MDTLASVLPIRPEATPLSPASVLAAHAHESGVDTEGIRSLFSRCAEAGYGFPSRVEAAVTAELAALAGAP